MSIQLQFDKLTIGWNGKIVDRDLSERVAFSGDNRFFAITGETGVGKSTLLDTLSGLKAPMAGTVEWTLDGKSVSWNEKLSRSMKRAIQSFHSRDTAFLLQRGEMIECLTIEQNIESALSLRSTAKRSDAARDMARTVVAQMMTAGEHKKYGVEGMLRCYPRQLSGGQSIRMALVVSMALDPTVLFVDEPTSSADPPTKKRMFKALGRWVTEGRDKAVVCITHDTQYLKEAEVVF